VPLPFATVRVYRQLVFPPGWVETARGVTNADGTYRIAHIADRQVRVAASLPGLFAQPFGGPVCYAEPCNTGTTIPAAIDQVLTGIDMTLSGGGSIAATILGAQSGGPLNGTFWIARADGSLAFTADHPAATYQTYALPFGTYYAAASRLRNNVRECELHQGQACLAGDPIDPATATPIVVGASGVQSIQFTLPNDDLLSNGFE
jgi:hypothetical protein